MSTTTFTNGVTLTDAGWFNDVDYITYDGATTTILVGGGAGTCAVWTTATGTGAPVRAGSPTLTGTITAAAITASGLITANAGISGTTGTFSGDITRSGNANDNLTRVSLQNTNAGTAAESLLTFINDSTTTGGLSGQSSAYTGKINGITLFNNSGSLYLDTGGVTRLTITNDGAASFGSNSLTAGAISGTTGAFSAAITSTATGDMWTATAAGTTGKVFRVGNTSGGLLIGIEGTPASYVAGATAYDAIIRGLTGLSLSGDGTNVQARITSTGLAVTGTLSATSYIEGTEETEPAAPAANGYRIFAVDSGGGKTILKVRFASGASQTIATEP